MDCTKCGTKLVDEQDEPVNTCPNCGKHKRRKVSRKSLGQKKS